MLPETGFLPFSRANFLMDFVVLAMAVIVPIMIGSVILVRYKKDYNLHKKIQIALGSILGLTLIVFELDVRLNGWRHLAEASPYYENFVFPSLFVHLFFAIPTFFLWLGLSAGVVGLMLFVVPDISWQTQFFTFAVLVTAIVLSAIVIYAIILDEVCSQKKEV